MRHLPQRFDVSYRGTSFQGYPIGTIAYYGPDDRTATKAVASIILDERSGVVALHRWVGRDVIRDTHIQREIDAFLAEHKARSIIRTERPVGCIHEEGEDFPVGTACPFCPFWRDRQ